MAQNTLDFNLSLDNVVKGTTAACATALVALGISAFFTEIDAYAEAFGVPLPAQASPASSTAGADKKAAKPAAGAVSPPSEATEQLVAPWIYAKAARNLCFGLIGVELVRRGQWEALGVWAAPIGVAAGIDAWICYRYGRPGVAVRHAVALPVFAALGGYLASA